MRRVTSSSLSFRDHRQYLRHIGSTSTYPLVLLCTYVTVRRKSSLPPSSRKEKKGTLVSSRDFMDFIDFIAVPIIALYILNSFLL
jgi:hypothetical protein